LSNDLAERKGCKISAVVKERGRVSGEINNLDNSRGEGI